MSDLGEILVAYRKMNMKIGETLLTKEELAPKIRRSVRTIDSWMKKGYIPYMKIGRSVLFRWSDVLAKLGEHRVN